MVAGVGIAPTSSAYETDVLLLDHPALWSNRMVEMEGVAPSSSPCKSDVLLLNYIPEVRVEEGGGIKPQALRLDLFSRQSRRVSPVHPPRN